MVECKVYYGLTDVEEAELFAEQTGLSRALESRSKFRAQYYAGHVDVTEMVMLTELAGLNCDFEKGQADNRIVAVSKLFKVFKSVSHSDFVEILKILKECWDGSKESLSTEILGGLYLFYAKYKGEFRREMLIKQLQKTSPRVIVREGKSYSGGGDMRFAREILRVYNNKLSSRRLSDKF